MNRIAALATLCGVLLAAGCWAPRAPAEKNAIVTAAKAKQAAPEYRIGATDSLTISVLGSPEHAVVAVVRPDGKISFPGYGDIKVEGKSAPELRKELERSFRKSLGLKDPTVYVSINSFGSSAITVLGEVSAPGVFPYVSNMRMIDVLGATRGFTLRSAADNTILIREVDGAVKVYKVHMKRFIKHADWTTNFYLRPGDIVLVPRNNLTKWADGIRLTVSPLAALFSFITLTESTVTLLVP